MHLLLFCSVSCNLVGSYLERKYCSEIVQDEPPYKFHDDEPVLSILSPASKIQDREVKKSKTKVRHSCFDSCIGFFDCIHDGCFEEAI